MGSPSGARSSSRLASVRRDPRTSATSTKISGSAASRVEEAKKRRSASRRFLVVPAADGVHRLVGCELLQEGGRRVRRHAAQLEEAGVERRAQQLAQLVCRPVSAGSPSPRRSASARSSTRKRTPSPSASNCRRRSSRGGSSSRSSRSASRRVASSPAAAGGSRRRRRPRGRRRRCGQHLEEGAAAGIGEAQVRGPSSTARERADLARGGSRQAWTARARARAHRRRARRGAAACQPRASVRSRADADAADHAPIMPRPRGQPADMRGTVAARSRSRRGDGGSARSSRTAEARSTSARAAPRRPCRSSSSAAVR